METTRAGRLGEGRCKTTEGREEGRKQKKDILRNITLYFESLSSNKQHLVWDGTFSLH